MCEAAVHDEGHNLHIRVRMAAKAATTYSEEKRREEKRREEKRRE
jgi:hypothetical protein